MSFPLRSTDMRSGRPPAVTTSAIACQGHTLQTSALPKLAVSIQWNVMGPQEKEPTSVQASSWQRGNGPNTVVFSMPRSYSNLRNSLATQIPPDSMFLRVSHRLDTHLRGQSEFVPLTCCFKWYMLVSMVGMMQRHMQLRKSDLRRHFWTNSPKYDTTWHNKLSKLPLLHISSPVRHHLWSYFHSDSSSWHWSLSAKPRPAAKHRMLLAPTSHHCSMSPRPYSAKRWTGYSSCWFARCSSYDLSLVFFATIGQCLMPHTKCWRGLSS